MQAQGGYYLAEMVGFEPTCPVKDKTISSRSRYDLFDTSPYLIDTHQIARFGASFSLCPVAVPEIFLHRRAKISTAAAPFVSLYLPPAALADVPSSIHLQMLN